MASKSRQTNRDWLTEDLKADVRKVFEPRYKHRLLDDEVTEIANRITDFLEVYIHHRYQKLELDQSK